MVPVVLLRRQSLNAPSACGGAAPNAAGWLDCGAWLLKLSTGSHCVVMMHNGPLYTILRITPRSTQVLQPAAYTASY